MKQHLTRREQEILILRYGLLGSREYTQREIARQLGISRSYVSRIEKKHWRNFAMLFPNDDSNILFYLGD